MQRRLEHLDLLRFIAVTLVMYGHYVMVAGGALSIPLVISDNFPLPLIDPSKWNLWKVEVFLVEKFSTQTAILGVTIFFLVTGYLIPIMLERYSRTSFLVNRFFRIFPVLFVAISLVGLFVSAGQGIHFSLVSYFASWTLLYPFFGGAVVTSVIWTLSIEVIFYLCASLIGKFSIYKLFLLQTLLIAVVLASVKFPNEYYLMIVGNNARYLLMISIGSAIFLAEKEIEWYRKLSLVLGAIILSYAGFQLYKFSHEDTSTYNNLGTHLLALAIFLNFHWLATLSVFKKTPNVIFWLSDLVYPIYLIHASIGLGVMALLRPFTTEPYLLVVAAITTSLSLSWILHIYVEKPFILIGRKFTRRLNEGLGN